MEQYPIAGYAPGNYHNRCVTCERSFFGDKRAVQCEPCALKDKAEFDVLSPEEQNELIARNMEAYRKAFPDGFWRKPATQPPSNTAVEELPMPRPVGEFILAQFDIQKKAHPTASGVYYHYSEVCELLNRYKAASTPQGAVARETIEDILLKTGKFNTDQCSEIADVILKDLSKGQRLETTVFVPCDENDPECCGGYQSHDGRGLAYVKEAKVPVVVQGAKWVNTEDRLPNNGERVIVQYRSGDYTRSMYQLSEDWWKRNVRRWLDESATPSSQSDAVEFGEWLRKTVHLDKEKHQWFVFHDDKWNYDTRTTAQLYEQFKKR